jgi:hypothetical protein
LDISLTPVLIEAHAYQWRKYAAMHSRRMQDFSIDKP